MFITEIVFKNIRSFTNEVKIDLNHNKKNIKEDLEENKLFLKNDVVFTPIISIGGANAKGKTSTLQSIDFALAFFNFSITDLNSIVNNILINTGINIAGFIDDKFKTIIKDFLKNSIKESYFHSEKIQKIEFFIEKIIKWFKEKKFNNIDDIFIKYLLEKFFWDRKFNLQKNWDNFKSHYKCSSLIKLKIFNENLGFFELILQDLYLDDNKSDISVNFIFPKKDEKLLDKAIDKLFDYNENICFYGTSNDLVMNTEIEINNVLNNLLKKLGKEKTLKIIRICDDSIIDLSYDSNLFNNAFFSSVNLITKNSSKKLNFLSQGTKKFLFLINVFVNIFKKNGLILIDEIDNYMHNELVNFFKMFIQIMSSKTDIQLIYTSHNPVCLASKVSAKQIYLIDKFEDEISFVKVSSKINKNNSVLKSLIEEKIGSHPSDNQIINLLIDLTDALEEKNEQ